MTNRRKLAAVSLLALALVAGCDSSDKPDVAAPPPVVVAPPPEDAFGANFGAAFRAGPNDAPRAAADGDIIPLTLSENPAPVG